ncbi:multi antimicrobial extrusion protein MatE [Paenibacillus sp. GCM10012307]|uniref:Multi antimicrobial extrusion protein MatE n=1 Tax=Paenibacillus roseus TaxID=2798579 RepID=A0A934J3S2_9BACL|nr:multi antimicrobial extrusion protein MatE [Paenibacillus roseus]MBJ6359833.1 multi antimicrobial extrusion protein MatE [Paenibacillus roseus]
MSSEQPEHSVSLARIGAFFLPLGISASLVTISHVIINSTLTRSADPERVIASYAIAMSMLMLVERPAVLLRQTCSALVRDKISFQAMLRVAQIVFASSLALGLIICYTPAGAWAVRNAFGLEESRVAAVIDVYKVLMFVSLFSGIRCLYHGVIIYHLRTKWLTIGMAIRLAGMYVLSLYFIQTGVTSGRDGAVIFLCGMMIEALVSFLEGRALVRKMPVKAEQHQIENKRQVFSFFRPLLLSTLVTLWILPAINAMLGKTWEAELSIAAFAIAASLVSLLISFFSYFHQIVLNFYRIDPAAVRKFTLMLGFVPAILLFILAYTPAGVYILEHIMGVQGRLQAESLRTLKAFALLTILMPWLDALNGLVLVRGQTKLMLGSQIANLSFTLLTLISLVWLAPHMNGTIGAWAQSIGMLAEFSFIALALRYIKPMDTALPGKV